MSTPTEPTTPQPKPADAAGLRFHNPDNLPSAGEPPWRFLVEGEHAEAGDEDWIGEKWVAIPYRYLPCTDTYRTKRPLPTPHAAEAGVRAGDVDLLADVAEWFEEQRTEQCRCHGGGETCDFCTHASNIKRARARRATPPATQSALEQAREALAKAQETLAFLAPYHNAGGIEETLTFVTAAINAVLPPAKGGAK